MALSDHTKRTALLPVGLYDLLPPEAAHERYVSGRLLEIFERFGYAQVSPPLMEFESSLLADRGAALAPQTFRVMDLYSQAMMGFRPDITMQVARIAGSRLAREPRPLRLTYGGSTLRMTGEGKHGARQWRQAGIELIGNASPHADAEVIAVSASAVQALGVSDIVVDLNLPGLLTSILQSASLGDDDRYAVMQAVESKDTGWLRRAKLPKEVALLAALVECAGPYEKARAGLEKLKLSKESALQLDHVHSVVAALQAAGLKAQITIDLLENRGFEYHSMISFSLFARATQTEIGRGGRYQVQG